jgi:hypothetical protein
MDAHLKRLADVSLALTAAEEALEATAYTGAREALDAAAEGLDALRGDWRSMSSAERAVIGRAARPLRERLDVARKRVPKLSALSEVEPDPADLEADEPPDAA